MARHNYPKRKRTTLEDRFDTDVVSLPRLPHIDRLIVVPLKTIYRNIDAAPWATEVKKITKFDDRLLDMIMEQL